MPPIGRQAQSQRQVVIPFVGAAHAYRRKYFTTTATIDASNHDVSPTGNEIFSSGYLRAHLIRVATKTAASDGTLSADDVWGLIHTLTIRQPGGQLMFGGPAFRGFHCYLATKQSGWKLHSDPKLLPSFTSSGTQPNFTIRQIFELNSQTALGSLPNQNDAAAWQLEVDTAVNTDAYQTKPTTTNPTLTFDHFIECWTVPSPQNPLRPSVRQITAPPLLGTLNKWTIQQAKVSGGSDQDIDLVRKGNSIRNLGFIVCSSTAAPNNRIATSNFPNPLTLSWDDTVIRSKDDPNLWNDDEFMVRGGAAAPTPEALDTGTVWLKFGDPAGVDLAALGLDGLGMVRQWGTTTTSTITVGGSWGASVDHVLILTNDVQYVIPKQNPYALAAGQPFESNAPLPSAVS